MRILARETAGAARTRSSLRPHFFEGGAKCKTSGEITPRDFFRCLKFESETSHVIARSESDEASQIFIGALDCLFPLRHGRASSRPSTSVLLCCGEDVDARDKPGHDEF
jgi:hypothetical protein